LLSSLEESRILILSAINLDGLSIGRFLLPIQADEVLEIGSVDNRRPSIPRENDLDLLPERLGHTLVTNLDLDILLRLNEVYSKFVAFFHDLVGLYKLSIPD
jgi:hypothetical protein